MNTQEQESRTDARKTAGKKERDKNEKKPLVSPPAPAAYSHEYSENCFFLLGGSEGKPERSRDNNTSTSYLQPCVIYDDGNNVTTEKILNISEL